MPLRIMKNGQSKDINFIKYLINKYLLFKLNTLLFGSILNDEQIDFVHF